MLCGPVGIGKQGYYVNVGGEAVYLFGKKNGSDLGKDFTTKRRHAKVVFYISGQSHYEKRSDFRSGLGSPMKSYYWMSVEDVQISKSKN